MVSTRASTVKPHVLRSTYRPLKSYRKQQNTYLPPTPPPGGQHFVTVAIQNGKGVRSHRRQRFRLISSETSVHGLWGSNSLLNWPVPLFDDSFDGNNALKADCTRHWYSVIARKPGTTVEDHNKKFWAGEWYGHGRECGLNQTEYFSFTIAQFLRLNPSVYPCIYHYCGPTVDHQNARRILDVAAFRQHLKRHRLHPAIRVAWTSFIVGNDPMVPHQELVEFRFNMLRRTSNVIDLYNRKSNIDFTHNVYFTSA